MVDVGFPSKAPVTFEIVCRTARGGRGVKHPVTVNPDGSVVTPHDLAAERVAAVFGGYLTCLELADRFVPSVRDLWTHRCRLTGPGIVRKDGRWAVAERVRGCKCAQKTWARPEEAAEHLRDARHWGRRHGVDPYSFKVWMDEFEGGVLLALPSPAWTGTLADAVPGRGDAAWLWNAGVHPDVVCRVHRELGLTEQLRAPAYLEVATGAVDLAWLRQFVPYGADTVAWAAATRSADDGPLPDRRLAWLAAGIGRSLILPLLDGPYSVEDVRRLAREAGSSLTAAGRVLVDWLAARCEPSIDQVARICRMDLGRYAPSGNAIAALRARAGGLAVSSSTTELGLVLVEAGSVPAAVSVLERRMWGLDDEGAA